MKKTLYFVVEKELEDFDGEEITTGNKTVTVYDTDGVKLNKFASLDLTNDESSIDAIQNYLKDNGHGDEEFELIQL